MWNVGRPLANSAAATTNRGSASGSARSSAKCVVVTTRAPDSTSRSRTARASAAPWAGSVPAPSSSTSTSVSAETSEITRLSSSIWPEKVERSASTVWRSPTIAMTREKKSTRDPSAQGTGIPERTNRQASPSVLSATVFPPVLGPVSTRHGVSRSTARLFATTATSRSTRIGWRDSRRSMAARSPTSGTIPCMRRPRAARATARSISVAAWRPVAILGRVRRDEERELREDSALLALELRLGFALLVLESDDLGRLDEDGLARLRHAVHDPLRPLEGRAHRQDEATGPLRHEPVHQHVLHLVARHHRFERSARARGERGDALAELRQHGVAPPGELSVRLEARQEIGEEDLVDDDRRPERPEHGAALLAELEPVSESVEGLEGRSDGEELGGLEDGPARSLERQSEVGDAAERDLLVVGPARPDLLDGGIAGERRAAIRSERQRPRGRLTERRARRARECFEHERPVERVERELREIHAARSIARSELEGVGRATTVARRRRSVR